ncbi:MAG: SDR family oxidoreductase [Candidatus Helarchaeota archaeon]|nr:SDR family oxidoreductase [Candidatus Helarchaeota archaeon]
MDLNLKGKTAIVTGGASGIGRQTCIDFAEEGANVLIADINEEGAKQVAKEIEDTGGKALAIKCDVTSTDDVKATVQKCMDTFNRVDILICNAGILRDNMIHKMSEDEYDLVLDVNLKGYWRFCKEAVPIMKKQKYGKIVMLSSMAYKGNRGQSNYATAKAGVVGLCKTIAQEVGYLGITCNTIAPGLVHTALTDYFVKDEKLRTQIEKGLILVRQPEVGIKLGTTKDISNAILFFASDVSSYITGEVLQVAAGRKM